MNALKKLSGVTLFTVVMFWALVVFRIATVPENHLSINVLWANYVFAPLAVLAVFVSIKAKGLLQSTVAVLAIATVIGVYWLYAGDILLPYEVWIDKGMPERPF